MMADRIGDNAKRLAAAWGDPIPAWTEATKRVADHAVKGVLFFHCNGSHPTEVGRRDIDWAAPQHRHQEWPAQLNRFFQLGALASGFLATGDEEYARAARDYIDDWIRAHPVRPDWALEARDNVLNLCIRMGESQRGGWVGTLSTLMASRAYDGEFVDRLVESALCQLRYLKEHLSAGSNWRIANADALVVCGILLDPDPLAAEVRRFGVGVLNDAFRRQILPDGSHIERNPSYHHWMAHVADRYLDLARAMPELGLEVEAGAVERMYDYSLACMAPDGGWNGLHDCQSRRSGFYGKGYAMREDRAAFRRKAGLPDAMAPTSQFFPNAGHACLRSSWEADADYLVFDATQWGGAHCHHSRNGIILYVGGKPILVDPGWLTYEMSDPMGPHGKTTRAHNTVNLNGWSQAETNPSRTGFHSLPGYDLVYSDYEGGYWPGRYEWYYPKGHGAGLWASHHRAVLWVRGRFIVVIDDVYRPSGGEDPSLEMNWQFEKGPVEVDEAGRRAVARVDGAGLLMRFPMLPDGMRMTLHEGEKDPIRGWLPADGGYIPAPQLTLEKRPLQDWATQLVTVLVPFRGAAEPEGVTATVERVGGESPAAPWRLSVGGADGARDEILWTRRLMHMLGEQGGAVTGGSLMHLRRRADGSVEGGAVFDGKELSSLAAADRRGAEL